MLLASSASDPLRSTKPLSRLPELPIVREIPSESISAAASTNTTSAMPMAVASVVTHRTVRLRVL